MHSLAKRQRWVMVAFMSALTAAVPVLKKALADPPNPLRNPLPIHCAIRYLIHCPMHYAIRYLTHS